MWYYRNSMIEWNYYRVALSNEEHIYDGVALRQNMIQNKKVLQSVRKLSVRQKFYKAQTNNHIFSTPDPTLPKESCEVLLSRCICCHCCF